MKLHRYLFLLLAFCLAVCVPRAARADDEVSFDYFYDNLKPYGEWVEVDGYGLCWHPSDIAEDWAPYTDGYWAYTDAGWTWVSYEDFGGIVYHYGRWVRVSDEGWCWVPDNDWGPAWVSWRDSDEYVGWAPLPPEAHFRPEVGISVWVDDTYDIGPSYYRFCRVRDFGAPVIREVCLPPIENVTFIRSTVNITNITINAGYGGPFCGGPRYDFVSLHVLRPIPALKLVRETNITNIYNVNVRRGDHRSITSLQRGNTLVMPAPRIRPVTDIHAALPNVRPARVLAANKVDRGWGTKTPQERDQLRQELRQQTKGATPENAHAKPVKAEDVKVVPVKADPKAASPVATRDRRPDRGGPGAGTDAAVTGNSGNLPPTAGRGGKPGTFGPAVDTNGDRQGKNAGRGALNPGEKTPSTVAHGEKTGEEPAANEPNPRVPGTGRRPGLDGKGEGHTGVADGAGPAPVPAATPRIMTAPRGSNQIPRRVPADEGTDHNPPTVVPKKGAGAGSPGAGANFDAQDAAERRQRAEALREQNAARSQAHDDAATAAQARERAAAAAENRERAASNVENRERAAAAAAQARERSSAAAENRDRAAAAAQQDRAAAAEAMRERAAAAAAMRERAAAARERAADAPRPQPQIQHPPSQPQPQMQRPVAPGASPAGQPPGARGKGKDKKDDER